MTSWNPMIVEQRSAFTALGVEHASVSVFNITLRPSGSTSLGANGKLQMASHAIGDIEALLNIRINEEDEEGTTGFEERKIRRLVIAACR
jgi:hypothetical protein